MKFAIRDDDLNYFYTPDFVDKNLREVFEICPVSMAAIPFVKGDWKRNTEILEKAGPGRITVDMVQAIKRDDKTFSIDLNKELIGYIREKVLANRMHIAIHGIHHRNEDPSLPVLVNNISIGAEFNTTRNLAKQLQHAVQMLEACFGKRIKIFTPPQNSYSLQGALAVFESGLNICGYLPNTRNLRMFINILGGANYLKYLRHRIKCKRIGFDYPFPNVLRYGNRAISDHCALQPATSPAVLMEKYRRVSDEGGDFVLSTHSYGFEYRMKDSRKTMKHCLLEILNEVAKQRDVRFVTIDEIFAE